MAFLSSEDDDKKDDQPINGGQQTATPPSSFNGVSSIGGSSYGSGTSPQQQASSAQNSGRSGRFVNLQTVMGQNTGLGRQVSDAGNNKLQSAMDTTNATLNPLRDANFTADHISGGLFDQASAETPEDHPGYYWGEGYGTGTGEINDPSHYVAPVSHQQAVDSRDSAMSRLRGILNQDYNGPGPTDFTLQGNKDLQSADELGDSRTVGAQLAQGPYSSTSGIGRLDQALYGTSNDSRSSMDALKKSLSGFRDETQKQTTDLNNKVTGFSKSAQDARDEARGILLGQGKTITDDLNAKAQAENSAASARYANGIGEWQGSTAGSAKSGDFANEDQVRKMSTLRQLIGIDPSVDQASGYVSGKYKPPEAEIPEETARPLTNIELRYPDQEYLNRLDPKDQLKYDDIYTDLALNGDEDTKNKPHTSSAIAYYMITHGIQSYEDYKKYKSDQKKKNTPTGP